MRIIAALADDSAATAVLSASSAIAGLFAAQIDALHVGEEEQGANDRARKAGLALRTVPGQPVQKLIEAANAGDVAAIVIGARGAADGKRPAGSTAMAIVTSLEKPVAVVPPAAPRRPIASVLVPLDGTTASAAALKEIVELASTAGVRIVVAHVHTPPSLPRFSDHLPHEVQAWSSEFIARHCPAALDAKLEVRVGQAHEHILDICRDARCDLVALGWSQDMTAGRAAVVRRMLADSPVPVLLTPLTDTRPPA